MGFEKKSAKDIFDLTETHIIISGTVSKTTLNSFDNSAKGKYAF